MIVLFAVAVVIYFGLAQRVLDRMRLTDGQALAFLGLIIVGGLIDIPVTRGPQGVTVNLGGAIVPFSLAIYLLTRAGTTKEWLRALLASLATAAAIVLIGSFTDFDPVRGIWIDPLWLFSLIGGAMGYIAGRSRRGAFIAGTLGVIFADLYHLVRVSIAQIPSNIAIGGAGVFDAVVLSGVIAVLFAEVFGEVRERLQGGPEIDDDRPLALQRDEGVHEPTHDGGDQQ